MHVYNPADPPLGTVATLLYQLLETHPRRLAFTGRAGSGKTSLCQLIAGTHPALFDNPDYLAHPVVPIINHADLIKEEVLEWLAEARSRAFIPDERSTFEHFCDFLGISPSIVEHDMMEVVGPLWTEMRRLLDKTYEHRLGVAHWSDIPPGELLGEKVAYVDAHKPLFRSALQLYGEVGKILSGDPGYWVDHTVRRGSVHRLCVNGDTRFAEELDILRYTGWTIVGLKLDDDHQRQRRPDLTEEQRQHASETSLRMDLCDVVLDANQPLPLVGMALADWIAARASKSARSKVRR